MPASQLGADRNGPRELGFYRFLNGLSWPGTYLGRLLLVCTVALSVPLFASLGLVVFLDDWPIEMTSIFAAALVGDAVGICIMFLGLRMAMAPFRISLDALNAYRRDRRLPLLPGYYDDEPGRLMREIGRTILSAEMVRADLLHRAETDPLTGVANRRRFLRRGVRDLAGARRSGEALSLVILDIDRFKGINDTHGHAAGDEVLKRLAGLLSSALRSRDSLARIGGEEFAIMLPDTSLADAVAIAEQLRHRMTSLPMPLLGGAVITASFGVTAAERDDADIEALMRRADRALYDAKRSGRNAVACRPTIAPDGTMADETASDPVQVAAISGRGGKTEVVWIVD